LNLFQCFISHVPTVLQIHQHYVPMQNSVKVMWSRQSFYYWINPSAMLLKSSALRVFQLTLHH